MIIDSRSFIFSSIIWYVMTLWRRSIDRGSESARRVRRSTKCPPMNAFTHSRIGGTSAYGAGPMASTSQRLAHIVCAIRRGPELHHPRGRHIHFGQGKAAIRDSDGLRAIPWLHDDDGDLSIQGLYRPSISSSKAKPSHDAYRHHTYT